MIPEPLKRPAFRRLWMAGLISETGDWLLLVSLPIFVYGLTGSTLSTAFAFLAGLAPAVLLSPIAGHLADRVDRRRLLVVIALAQAATLLPLLAVHSRRELPLLYGVIAIQAALLTLFDPAKSALLPTLVDAEHLVPANSLVGLNANLGRLAGGPLGGLVLAVSGLPAIVAVDAVSFLLAATLIWRLPASAPAQAPARSLPAESPRAGPLSALRGRTVRGALGVATLAGLAQGIFTVLFLVFVARELHGGDAQIGLLRGIQAVGAIGGGLYLATARRTPAPGALTAWALTVFGVLAMVIWNAPRLTIALPLYIGLFVLVGVPAVAMMTGIVSLLQQSVPDGQRGRVFATFIAIYEGSTGLGMLGAGLFGDRVGTVALLNVQATLYLLAGAFAARALIGRTASGQRAIWAAESPG
jgi:MFS family permease